MANLDAAPVQVEGCRARAFWMLARHGARNPGGSAIRAARTVVADLHRNIIRNYQEGKGSDSFLRQLILKTNGPRKQTK